ncbi:hypothetical protein ZIOFF_023055 [Zingiber officinale]|uniref:Zeaxanthin epoxidase, chloroplastic n=1 Tax=Zingiber officinale TaxID=94328 RepID=A0A8J5HMF5_ZINOF|nr:hypothetical protein ZIOFF_023055 [Zingiber officinale]
MALLYGAPFHSPPLPFPKIHHPNSSHSFFSDASSASASSGCCCKSRRRSSSVVASATGAPGAVSVAASEPSVAPRKLRILIAGGGIGGLVFALAAKRKGFEVLVFEKDVSAIRGEGQYRGPIQIQSNALAALEAIDMDVAEEVMNAGCITGDRINGLVDGISGSWYTKFDTFTPAAERGLPVTRVISRMTLQQILARALGDDLILNDSNVVDFVDNGDKLRRPIKFVHKRNATCHQVTVVLENGQQHEGDLLVGADGIWSNVRKVLFGFTEASYSGYTCYTGIADFIPPDIETVGYRVFLGHKQYFVSSDVGAGKMQWYAFHNEPPGGTDVPNGKRKRLLKIFGGWCDNVIDLLEATDEEAILRRDIYDRIPIMNWGKGRVTLLGDSVHAMQPNMGQGGCMAIEDSYELALELEKSWNHSVKTGQPMDIISPLKRYEEERRLRVAVIYGMARMAANMASTYRPFLGVGLGPLSFLTKFRIPHPGRVGGRFLIKLAMPLMLDWVLGGNSSKLAGRPLSCRLSDKASDQLKRWFEDDDEMERAMGGESRAPADKQKGSIVINSPQVAEEHVRITCKDNVFFLTDLRSQYGTWITDKEWRRYRVPPNFPVRIHPFDVIELGNDKKVVDLFHLAYFRFAAVRVTLRVKVTKALPKTHTNGEQPILQAV